MTQITTVGLDLAKLVFQVHGADADGKPVVRKKLRRSSDWKRVPVLITGRASCRRLVMKCV